MTGFKAHLNPLTLDDAEISYSILRTSYTETKEALSAGGARGRFLFDYLSALEKHENYFTRLMYSHAVRKELSQSLKSESENPKVYEDIKETLNEIAVEKSRIRTALTKTPHIADLDNLSSY